MNTSETKEREKEKILFLLLPKKKKYLVSLSNCFFLTEKKE